MPWRRPANSWSVRGTTSALDRERDNVCWFGRINMAATVMLVEQKIIPPELAVPIARGVAHAIDQATKPGLVRPTDVLAALRTDPQRLLDELESDWTPSMALAETLQHEHQVQPRVCRAFATLLTR